MTKLGIVKKQTERKNWGEQRDTGERYLSCTVVDSPSQLPVGSGGFLSGMTAQRRKELWSIEIKEVLIEV